MKDCRYATPQAEAWRIDACPMPQPFGCGRETHLPAKIRELFPDVR
jgi:hypothetical protein